jgi:outer membrane receptor protein involved in Fe transport
VQVNYALPTCGFGYTINGGKAASKGADLQTQIRLIDTLTLNLQAAYTNAQYTDAVTGPAPTRAKFINEGDPLPSPKWTSNVGVQYTLPVGNFEPYIRADYQYQSSHVQGFGPGTSSYTPDTFWVGSANYVSARAGMYLGGLDLSLFANNLFNSQPILSAVGGRSGCSAAAGPSCSVYRQYNPVFMDTTFQPRTVGVTVDYRF